MTAWDGTFHISVDDGKSSWSTASSQIKLSSTDFYDNGKWIEFWTGYHCIDRETDYHSRLSMAFIHQSLEGVIPLEQWDDLVYNLSEMNPECRWIYDPEFEYTKLWHDNWHKFPKDILKTFPTVSEVAVANRALFKEIRVKKLQQFLESAAQKGQEEKASVE
jgi:hypothetical protein